jgi:hydrogenase nickel incorporation protein HypA/HybF
MDDLMRKIESVAHENGGVRVLRITVRLGALSHFTPEHFREHFADASRGTLAAGADVDAVVDVDVHAPNADGVLLESIEVEPFEPIGVW